MDISQLNFAAVLVAALACFVLGGIWYSPLMFAQAWMREAGLTETDLARGGKGRIFGVAFLCTLVMAFNLAAFIGREASLTFAVFAGIAAGLGWVAMSLGVIYLFERRSLKLWAINSGYLILAFILMSAIIGAWK